MCLFSTTNTHRDRFRSAPPIFEARWLGPCQRASILPASVEDAFADEEAGQRPISIRAGTHRESLLHREWYPPYYHLSQQLPRRVDSQSSDRFWRNWCVKTE